MTKRKTQLKGVVEAQHRQLGYPKEPPWQREGQLKSGVQHLETGVGEAMGDERVSLGNSKFGFCGKNLFKVENLLEMNAVFV